MPLWGNSDAVEAKPKHFTDAEKLKNVKKLRPVTPCF